MFKCGVFTGPLFNPNTGKYGLEKTPYLDTFHAVYLKLIFLIKLFLHMTKKSIQKFEYLENEKSF